MISCIETGHTLYVGESHSYRLRKTLTRHFQKWTDRSGRPHATYQREKVLVGVIETCPRTAVQLEEKLLWALWPKDNLDRPSFRPDWNPTEEAPF